MPELIPSAHPATGAQWGVITLHKQNKQLTRPKMKTHTANSIKINATFVGCAALGALLHDEIISMLDSVELDHFTRKGYSPEEQSLEITFSHKIDYPGPRMEVSARLKSPHSYVSLHLGACNWYANYSPNASSTRDFWAAWDADKSARKSEREAKLCEELVRLYDAGELFTNGAGGLKKLSL